jgi:hypothetical protein
MFEISYFLFLPPCGALLLQNKQYHDCIADKANHQQKHILFTLEFFLCLSDLVINNKQIFSEFWFHNLEITEKKLNCSFSFMLWYSVVAEIRAMAGILFRWSWFDFHSWYTILQNIWDKTYRCYWTLHFMQCFQLNIQFWLPVDTKFGL